MNNSQVAHLWANQSKASAKGSNFYFEGKTIFSYGSHFPIATIYNENTILFNANDYSVTTGRHKSYVRSAIDETRFKVLLVENLDTNINFDVNKIYFKNCFELLQKEIMKSRKYKEQLKSRLDSKIDDYKYYCKLFKLKIDKSILKIDEKKLEKEIQKERQAKKEREAHYRQLEKEREERKLLNCQKELNKFLNDDENIKTVEYRKDTNFLKIKTGELVNGNQVCITNKGAEVPRDHVKNLVEIIDNAEKYCGQSLNGRKIGNFTINSFDEKGMKIGCHFFDTQEINRIISLFK